MTHPDHIQFLTPSTLAPTPGYSQVVKVTGGQTIYLAGQVALDASRNLIGRGDFRAQAQQVFENIKIALESVGAFSLLPLTGVSGVRYTEQHE